MNRFNFVFFLFIYLFIFCVDEFVQLVHFCPIFWLGVGVKLLLLIINFYFHSQMGTLGVSNHVLVDSIYVGVVDFAG